MDNQKLVKGFMFEQMVAFLKEKKGEAAVAELEKNYGSLLFDKYQMYSMEKLLTLQKEVVTSVFGTESEDGYLELGKFAYTSYVQTLVGATLINSSSPVVLLKKIQELWNSVVNFGERKIVALDENAGKATIAIVGDPSNPSYLLGVIQAGLVASNAKDAKAKIGKKNDDSCTIEVQWTP